MQEYILITDVSLNTYSIFRAKKTHIQIDFVMEIVLPSIDSLSLYDITIIFSHSKVLELSCQLIEACVK